MNWQDFGLGVWIGLSVGILATLLIISLTLTIWSAWDRLKARVQELEDRAEETTPAGRDDAEIAEGEPKC
jgi:hypothetical protein